MASHDAEIPQSGALPSSSPSTSYVFASTRSSLARRTAVLSKDTLDRHAAGASRYRARLYPNPFFDEPTPEEGNGRAFDGALFTRGFVPLSGAAGFYEAGASNASAASARAPNGNPTETQPKRTHPQSNVPPAPPPTPYGYPPIPAARPPNSATYSKLSLSELADMVVRASLTPPAVSGPELEAARAYPFPNQHRHRSNSVVSNSPAPPYIVDHTSFYLRSVIGLRRMKLAI